MLSLGFCFFARPTTKSATRIVGRNCFRRRQLTVNCPTHTSWLAGSTLVPSDLELPATCRYTAWLDRNCWRLLLHTLSTHSKGYRKCCCGKSKVERRGGADSACCSTYRFCARAAISSSWLGDVYSVTEFMSAFDSSMRWSEAVAHRSTRGPLHFV
jgi:hypothetical protein